MSIMGINQDKCIKCKNCIYDCPATLFKEMENGDIKYLTNEFCIRCGHCISICPEDAILHEMGNDVKPYPKEKSSENFVDYESLLHLFRSKRSVRQYKKEKVKKEILEKIFAGIRYSPTGGNSRLWRFLVISDSEKIQVMREKIIAEVSKVSEPYARGFKIKKKLGIDPVFFGASQIIVLYYPKGINVGNYNSAIALTYAMLAAETLGLGTCWIGMAQGVLSTNKEIRDLIGIKGNVGGVITIGYPNVKYYRFPPRDPLKIEYI